MQNEMIRVALQGDDSSLNDEFERSGMVEMVETAPQVLAWQLPHDQDGLPEDLRLALADPHGPAVIVLTDGHPAIWFQEALALGVDDVIVLPQPPSALGLAAAKACAMRSRRSAAASAGAAVKAYRDAHIVSVFSTKGGSGKTVIATNLAVAFARAGRRTLLMDFDLHSGDDALVLGLSPRWTILDLVQSPGDLDAEKLAGFVTRHQSGVDLLPAPTRPDEEELVSVDRLEPLIEIARESYDVVVIDTSSLFSPATLLAIDNTDTLILVGASDVPTIKSLKIALETLDLLELVGQGHPHRDEPLRGQGRPRGPRRGAHAAARDHLHDLLRQGDPGLGQPRPAGRDRRTQVPRRPLAVRHGGLARGGGREQAVKPDRTRSLAGRLRRNETAGKPAEVKVEPLNDPFAEVKRLAQAEAVRDLGQAFSEGEVPEDELRDHVQRAVDAALAEAGTPLSSADRSRLVTEITQNILGFGPIEPLLLRRHDHRDHGQRPPHDLRRAQGRDRARATPSSPTRRTCCR